MNDGEKVVPDELVEAILQGAQVAVKDGNIVVKQQGADDTMTASEQQQEAVVNQGISQTTRAVFDHYNGVRREHGIEQAFDSAVGKVAEISEDLESPPLVEVPIIGHEDNELLVLLEKRRTKVSLFKGYDGGLSVEDFEVGDTCWFHMKSHMVVGPTQRKALGVIGNVKKVRDGQMLVDAQGIGEFWLDSENFGEVKPGFKASVLDDKSVVAVWEEPSHMQMLDRPTGGYENVGGLDDVIEKIQRKVELPLKYSDGFEKMGIRRGGGIMMHGPPGCGKTLLARCTAAEADAAFFNVKISDIMSKWLGESESRITSLFQKARDNAPSIVFIDEIESIGGERGNNAGSASRAYTSIVSQLLTELDGMDNRGDVVVLAATNRIDLVDDALLRPGRFDDAIEIPPPGKEAALKIAEVHMSNALPFEDGVEASDVRQRIVDVIFDNVEEPNGAIIEGFCNETKVACVNRCGNDPKISMEDVDSVLESEGIE